MQRRRKHGQRCRVDAFERIRIATMTSHRMTSGDLVVQLRSPQEILATLDETGATDGLPFMPEMLEFLGGRFRVQARVERACDTLSWGVRRLPDTVLLDDLRCSGQAHAGCQAGCRLYWKEVWLRPASESAMTAERDNAFVELERLVSRNVSGTGSTATDPIFRCQGTNWFAASEPVGWWSARSLLNELTTGNVSSWHFTKTMTRAVLGEVGRRLHMIRPQLYIEHDPLIEPPDPPSARGLDAGTLVQIRSRHEIARTLDADRKNRGLWFDPPSMVPHCGKIAPIKRRVERIIDERTGKLVDMKNDCYILDGIVCGGDRKRESGFALERSIHTGERRGSNLWTTIRNDRRVASWTRLNRRASGERREPVFR